MDAQPAKVSVAQNGDANTAIRDDPEQVDISGIILGYGNAPTPEEDATEPRKRCKECGSESKELKHCGSCKIAAYCSQKCQAKDYKSHKKGCIPHRVIHFPEDHPTLQVKELAREEFFVAKTDVEPYTLLLEEAPLIFICYMDFLDKDDGVSEALLGAKGGLKGVTNVVRYATDNAATRAGINPSAERIMTIYLSKLPWLCRLPFLRFKTTEEEARNGAASALYHACGKSIPFKEVRQEWIDDMRERVDALSSFTCEDIYQGFLNVGFNAISVISTMGDLRIGEGFFPSAWRLVKSCSPNCRIAFNRGKLQVFSIRKIKKGDPIVIPWIPTIQQFPLPTRYKLLHREYGIIVCYCPRCMSAYKEIQAKMEESAKVSEGSTQVSEESTQVLEGSTQVSEESTKVQKTAAQQPLGFPQSEVDKEIAALYMWMSGMSTKINRVTHPREYYALLVEINTYLREHLDTAFESIHASIPLLSFLLIRFETWVLCVIYGEDGNPDITKHALVKEAVEEYFVSISMLRHAIEEECKKSELAASIYRDSICEDTLHLLTLYHFALSFVANIGGWGVSADSIQDSKLEESVKTCMQVDRDGIARQALDKIVGCYMNKVGRNLFEMEGHFFLKTIVSMDFFSIIKRAKEMADKLQAK